MIRLLVGDRFGRILAELEADVASVSWRLNDVGKLTFEMAKTDPKLTQANLSYGNLVLAQFDNGLPDWGGVIDPPRDWGPAAVGVTAYSAEYLLGTRQTDEGRYFDGTSVGVIFQSVIEEAGVIPPWLVEVGQVWTGGTGHSPAYHFKSLLEICRDSIASRLSTAEFDLVPTVSAGTISFVANLYERKGSDKPGVALIEGKSLTEDARLKEQGTIVNSWDLAGAGSSWDKESGDRPFSHKEDAASIATYGLREDSKVFNDVSIQATLDAHAENLLAESKDPHNMLDLEALDRTPGLFADYDLGDSVMVQLYSYGFGGFSGMVRLLGREYDPRSDACKLVVREVT